MIDIRENVKQRRMIKEKVNLSNVLGMPPQIFLSTFS